MSNLQQLDETLDFLNEKSLSEKRQETVKIMAIQKTIKEVGDKNGYKIGSVKNGPTSIRFYIVSLKNKEIDKNTIDSIKSEVNLKYGVNSTIYSTSKGQYIIEW